MADTKKELYRVVDKIGVDRRWIQKEGEYEEHFDVCSSMKQLALKMDDVFEVSTKKIVRIMHGKREVGNT